MPPGSTVTSAAATVFEILKLVLSAIWMRPPLFSFTGSERDRRKIDRFGARLHASRGLVGREIAWLLALEDPEVVERDVR